MSRRGGHRYEPFPIGGGPGGLGRSGPGDNERAGKHHLDKMPPGNRAFQRALVRAAQATKRKKDNYLREQSHRIAARRGKKPAIVAVAHSILVIFYRMLSRREPYRDKGGNYSDDHQRESLVICVLRRLTKSGYQVASEPIPVAVPAAAELGLCSEQEVRRIACLAPLY